MQRKFASYFIALVLLVGAPLAGVSFVDVYSKAPADRTEQIVSVEFKTFHNGDSPIQQGDIRNQKHASQKIRATGGDDFKQFVAETHNLSNFKFSRYQHAVNTDLICRVPAPSQVPLFIKNRQLVI